jgi:hypothetical protein
MPVLTFPLATLATIESGHKSATIRFDRRLAKLEAGTHVTCNFGARNKPTVRHARVTRLEVLDFKRLSNKDNGVLEAMTDSGNVFGEIYAEVIDRKRFGEPSIAFAVWLKLE